MSHSPILQTSAPLINEYKANFFWRRFARTVLGGPNIYLSFKVPWYIYFIQIILLLIPCIIGGFMTVLAELVSSNVASHSYAIIYGSIIASYALALQLTAYFVGKKFNVVENLVSDILDEEDQLDFNSCCSSQTLYFIFGKKKYLLTVIFHPLLAGGVCGLTFYYLLPSNISTVFTAPLTWIPISILGWITLSVTQYSLTVTRPPEPAIYRTTYVEELEPLRRPFYVAAIIIFDLATRTSAVFSIARTVLYIIFCLLPLLWSFGFLPPLDALITWLAEQVLVIGYGGSPMANDIRLLIHIIITTTIFLPTCFVSSSTFTIIYSACFGYILSLDLFGMASYLYAKLKHKDGDLTSLRSKLSIINTFGWELGIVEIIAYLIMLAVIAGIATATSITTSLFSTSDKAVINNILGYIMIVIVVLIKLLGDLQGVYLFWGLLPNPIYPLSANTKDTFMKRRKRLQSLGHVYRVLLIIVAPLLMLIYLGFNLSLTAGTNTLSLFVFGLGTIRSTRWIWQSTVHALLEMCVVFLVTIAFPTSNEWSNLGLGLQLLIVGLARNRIQLFFGNLYFASVLSVTSYSHKKLRTKWTVPLLAVVILTFPVTLAIIALASALSAPLLPLFTAPIFLLGFPRPRRVWSSGGDELASRCKDTVYYQQIMPALTYSLSKLISSGALREPSPGTQYLLRFQDRLIWVVILERGYGYCNFNVKGLEMQETSCHTVEAARIDDIFELTFERADRDQCCTINKYFLNSLQPVDATYIKTYSDAQGVVTGILDSPDNVKMLTATFADTLTWILIHQCMNPTIREALNRSVVIRKKQSRHSVGRSTIKSRLVNNLSITKDSVSNVPVPGSRMLLDREQADRVQEESEEEDDIQSTHATNPPKFVPERSQKRSINDSIWSDDDDSLFGSEGDDKGKIETVIMQKRASKGTAVTARDSILSHPYSDSLDFSEMQDNNFTFGGPAVDISIKKQSTSIANNSSISGRLWGEGQMSLDESIDNNMISHVDLSYLIKAHNIDLPQSWNALPIDPAILDDLIKRYFRKDWLQYVLTDIAKSSNDDKLSKIVSALASDEKAIQIFAKIVMMCYSVVDTFGVAGGDAQVASMEHIHRSYHGEISPSPQLDWLLENKLLKEAVIKAYRYAVKVIYDTAILGEISGSQELAEYLTDYDKDWTICTDNCKEWSEGVLQSKPYLYSFGYDKDKNTYTTRVLTLQDVLVHVGMLSAESIQSQWSSLALELLYFTNDDEERYSIQAHPVILRNLVIQAADPPLGYPIYASGALSIPLLS